MPHPTSNAISNNDDDVVCPHRHITKQRLQVQVPQPIKETCFLSVGTMFSGSQTVKKSTSSIPTPPTNTNSTSSVHTDNPAPNDTTQQQCINSIKDPDEWRVNVTIQGIDVENGHLSGSMEALDVPKTEAPVITYWTGEIIDNVNNFFRTRRWIAPHKKDMEHWESFIAFTGLLEHDVGKEKDLNALNLAHHRYIFMRWKELFFVSPGEECGLTIQGFYYLCMDRYTGAILGFYYDPECRPFQQLQLNAVSTSNGFTHPHYSFN